MRGLFIDEFASSGPNSLAAELADRVMLQARRMTPAIAVSKATASMRKCRSLKRLWIYTMKRVISTFILLSAMSAMAWGQAPATQELQGQNLRRFPEMAMRGTLQVGAPPLVLLNGKQAELAPGARIFNEQNMLLLSGSISGGKYLVNYTLDMFGQLKDVWILTPEEARQKGPAQQRADAEDKLKRPLVAR
jgi:hypothetical protein